MADSRRGRWTAEQERDAALAILACEDKAVAALADVPAAQAILSSRAKRAERTRAGAVERLERAVDAAWESAKLDPTGRPAARAAKAARAPSPGP